MTELTLEFINANTTTQEKTEEPGLKLSRMRLITAAGAKHPKKLKNTKR